MSKIFKRLVLSTAAVAMLAVPVAQAQSRHHDTRQDHHASQQRHPVAKKHSWKRGERVSDWRKRESVRDYRRHGLRAPGRGQQWVKVDNDYLLVSLATGVILGVTASR